MYLLKFFRIFQRLFKFNSIIKIIIGKKISKLSNSKVINGLYKNTYLSSNSRWGKSDYASKLLGLYESQVQEKIIQIKKKFNLSFIINFGAADGYHIAGLLRNQIFKKGIAFEKDERERKNLLNNFIKNKVERRVDIFAEADFNKVFKLLSEKDLKKSLFLIDIEGSEFELFNNENVKKLKNSFFIIEIHEFIKVEKKLKKNFFNLIKKNFNIELIKNSERNPFNFEFLNDLNDDERWLLMSEGRPSEMYWLFCFPKKA